MNFLVAQAHRTSASWRVWRKPRNEPFIDVDRAILVAVHDQSTVRTAIGALPQRHRLEPFAAVAHLARVVFIDHVQVFPKAFTFVRY